MSESDRKNNNGFALIGTIIAILIIAAIFFGSSYFSKDKDEIVTPVGQLKAERKAESDVDKINQLTKDRNQEIIDDIK